MFLHHEGVENVRQYRALLYFELEKLENDYFYTWVSSHKMLFLPGWSRMFIRHESIEKARQFRPKGSKADEEW